MLFADVYFNFHPKRICAIYSTTNKQKTLGGDTSLEGIISPQENSFGSYRRVTVGATPEFQGQLIASLLVAKWLE